MFQNRGDRVLANGIRLVVLSMCVFVSLVAIFQFSMSVNMSHTVIQVSKFVKHTVEIDT